MMRGMMVGLAGLVAIGLSASAARAGELPGPFWAGPGDGARVAGRIGFVEAGIAEAAVPVVRYREPIIGRGLVYNVPPPPFAGGPGPLGARY